jgi:hypothetical protein
MTHKKLALAKKEAYRQLERQIKQEQYWLVQRLAFLLESTTTTNTNTTDTTTLPQTTHHTEIDILLDNLDAVSVQQDEFTQVFQFESRSIILEEEEEGST